MKRSTLLATLFVAFVTGVAALGIGAAVDMPRTLMSPQDYQDLKRGIEASTRAALGACRSLEGMARETCKAQARGDERVKKAQLQARYQGTVQAAAEIQVARVRAQYDVARARCSAQSGDERLQCLRAAREARTREMDLARVASTT